MCHNKSLDIFKRNLIGETALDIALRLPNIPFEIIEQLTALEIMYDQIPTTSKRRRIGNLNVLRKALQSADSKKAKQIFKSGVDVNEMDKHGYTILHSFAVELVNLAARENTVWDLFSKEYIDLFRYLLCETAVDVTLKTREKNKNVIELVLDETFKHHYYRRTFFDDVARLLEPLVTAGALDLTEQKTLYVCVFRIYFVGVKSGSNKLVEFCIEQFYGASNNKHHSELVQKFISLYDLAEHKERYVLCLLLHDQYEMVVHELGFLREQMDQGSPTIQVELQNIFKVLVHTSVCFNERMEVLIELLLKLKQHGYHLERTHVIDTLATSIASEDISVEQAKRIQTLFHEIFKHFHINFNNLLIQVLEKIPNFMMHILQQSYLELTPIQIVVPFCTNVFYSVSTLFFTVLYNENFPLGQIDSSLLTLSEFQKLTYQSSTNEYKLMPLSLQELCRSKIRRHIHRELKTNKAFVDTIMSFPVPELIHKYLRFMDHL